MAHKFLFCILVCMGTAASGAPARYYQWMSKVDGSRVCSQTSLGEGWERVDGPFVDSRCRKRPN